MKLTGVVWRALVLVSALFPAWAAASAPAAPAPGTAGGAHPQPGPIALLAHRPTYVLPLTWVTGLNLAPYGAEGRSFRHQEMEFQLSIAFPVWRHPLGSHSDLAFAYTQRAFWQAYDRADSSPFRETDHEPEAMLDFHTNLVWRGFHTRLIRVALDHQSNGRADPLSRSWNRVYVQFIAERGDLALSFKPWYRIPERAANDNNPDITHYLGYGEVTAAFRRGRDQYRVMVRDNLNSGDNKGAIQLGWSYPLNDTLRGYIQFFDGYGESLIDYNVRVTRIGVGVMLNSWL